MANAISAQIKLEGGRSFANEFKNAASAVKAANSELALLDSEVKKNGASSQLLAKRADAVSKAFDAEQNQIDLLTSRMEELNQLTGVDTSQAMNELTAELNKHKKAQSELGDSLDESGNDFTDFANDVAKAQIIMSAMKDVVIAVGKKIWSVGKGAVEYNSQMESYSKTIEAFFKTSGQSSEEATKNTEELIQAQKELATQTGIGTDKLIDANKMLIAAGMSGDTSQKAISALSKAIVATGGGNEELSRMAQNLQQIANTGKASAQDLKQFSAAGVDVYGLMADSTGKTVEQLHDMDITFDMIVEALDLATQEGGKFFEASQVGASTLQGQMNLLKSSIDEGLGTAFEPVNTALREQLIPAATQLIEDIDWNAVGDAIAWAVSCVTDFVNAVDEFRNWYNEVYGPKPQETINAFTASQEDLNEAFIRTGGNVQIFDSEMAGAVEAVKGHGNHMAMEFDGMSQTIDTSVQQTAGEVKNMLIDMGWEMMTQGETDAYKLGEGIASGAIKPKTETQAIIDEIQRNLDGNKKTMYESGADFVSGFASGMHDNNGLIANAAAGIANTITRLLHFSKPDEGPLRDYETWMPDFVGGLARTMRESEWMLADASQDLAQTITNNTVTNNISMTVNGAQGQSAQEIADVVMVKIQQATNRRNAVWA